MDFTTRRATQILAALLIAIVATQALYTLLYVQAPDVPRGPIWGVEGILFLAIAIFAAQPMIHAKRYTVGWAAILGSGLLNHVQVAVGVTMFRPFGEVAGALEATSPLVGSVVAYSFFMYNGAKVMLGFAALIFGMAMMKSATGAKKALGGIAALVGVAAMIANAAYMLLGRIEAVPAGALGVAATLLLALTLSHAVREES